MAFVFGRVCRCRQKKGLWSAKRVRPRFGSASAPAKTPRLSAAQARCQGETHGGSRMTEESDIVSVFPDGGTHCQGRLLTGLGKQRSALLHPAQRLHQHQGIGRCQIEHALLTGSRRAAFRTNLAEAFCREQVSLVGHGRSIVTHVALSNRYWRHQVQQVRVLRLGWPRCCATNNEFGWSKISLPVPI